jgi:hypothetical protein
MTNVPTNHPTIEVFTAAGDGGDAGVGGQRDAGPGHSNFENA